MNLKLKWRHILFNAAGAVGFILSLNMAIPVGIAFLGCIAIETMIIGALLMHIDSNRGHAPLDG